MIYISKIIITHKKKVVALFTVIAVICLILLTQVSVNYNIVDYLPEDAQSTKALSIMDAEFEETVPNARVMLHQVSITQALYYKEQLKQIEGVVDAIWLDDIIDLKEPIEMADKETVENYYKDETALISISIADGKEVKATEAIYELIGEDNAASGNAINTATAQKMSVSESVGAVVILVPIIILILLLSTSSWMDPVLFLLAIGISVLINMGTNVIFGEVSFITQAISPILQMAVSLDYAIFLLHSFEDYRKKTKDINEAMRLAIKRSFPAIMASAATTLFGFMALAFMKFRIGSDLGINLVKGIVLSYLSVMIFLPALTLLLYKQIDKTKHKILLPRFENIGKRLKNLRIPFLILAIILLIPSYLAQKSNTYIYGTGSVAENSRSGLDEIKISESFGKSTSIVLLVPKGEVAKEKLLCEELNKIKHVNGVVSYATTVGTTIPNQYVEDTITSQFYSENYCRIILYTGTQEEGEEAFAVVEAVQAKANEYYDKFYTCGQSVNLYDMREVVTKDNNIVNLIAVVTIALVLFVSFKSLTIPLLLLITIELAIWINLSVPYFSDNPLCYIGFLVINTVQLGATVDYAILITENYKRNRKEMPKMEAMNKTLGENFISILVSGIILASAGFCLAYTSSNPIVAELGVLLGRGTILSMSMVVLLLPALLLLFDKVIDRTTYKANFYKEK
jgi:predicted RND superfamily exporter protein